MLQVGPVGNERINVASTHLSKNPSSVGADLCSVFSLKVWSPWRAHILRESRPLAIFKAQVLPVTSKPCCRHVMHAEAMLM